eukprot:g3436.t1
MFGIVNQENEPFNTSMDNSFSFGTTKRRNPFGEDRQSAYVGNAQLCVDTGKISNVGESKYEATFSTLMNNAQAFYATSRDGFEGQENCSRDGLGFYASPTSSSSSFSNSVGENTRFGFGFGQGRKASSSLSIEEIKNTTQQNTIIEVAMKDTNNDNGDDAHLNTMCYVCQLNTNAQVPCAHCGHNVCDMCLRQCELCQDVFCSLCTTVNYASRYDRTFCISCNSSHSQNLKQKLDLVPSNGRQAGFGKGF